MTMRILWPNLPAEFEQISRDAVGPGFETEFCRKFSDVTDEQWANADAIAQQLSMSVTPSCGMASITHTPGSITVSGPPLELSILQNPGSNPA